MRYSSYSIDDFVQDDFFQQWVSHPTEETNRFWADFLASYPHKEEELEAAKALILALKREPEPRRISASRIKQKLNAQIDQHELVEGQPMRSSDGVRMRKLRYYGIAASLTLMVMLAGYYVIRNNATPSSVQTVGLHYETPRGSQRQMVLEDGTRVWLNADSRLVVKQALTVGQRREVFLEGEAYFDVAEDPSRPFIVNTKDIEIVVLGTAFNVRAYQTDHSVETTLVRGKIALSLQDDKSSPIMLSPNDQAIFRRQEGRIELEKNVESNRYTGWKEGWIEFNERPFDEIVRALERQYNVTIHVDDLKSQDCPFSARFKDMAINEVLELFKSTESIDYTIDDNQVTISGVLCDNLNPGKK